MLEVLLTLATLAKPVENIVVHAKASYCKTHLTCVKLAEAVFFESRGEVLTGQYAVAHTIVTRKRSGRWPDDIRSVVNQKRRGVCQFSYMCQFKMKRDRMKVIQKNDNSWRTALVVATDVLFGLASDPTNGADHFYNPDKVKQPVFARTYEFVARIGNHRFYRSTQCKQYKKQQTFQCRSRT